MWTAARSLALSVPFILAACAGQMGKPPINSAPLAIERQDLKDDVPMRSLALILAILAIALLSACALYRNNASWVDDLKDDDAVIAAATISALITDRIQPGEKPIRLVPPPADQEGNRLTTELKIRLTEQGYTLAGKESTGEAHSLRYLITAYSGGGYVLRVQLDGGEATTMLKRSENGALVAVAPLTIREAAQ